MDTPVVLCVDDNPTNLKLLSDILANEPYTLLMARSGARALEIARRRTPTLVLLDITMPEMDGFEVCRALKSDPETASAAVIFLSALRDAASKVRGLGEGAVDFVSKPFEVDEVLARVRTHLRLKALERELASKNAALSHDLEVAQELLRDAREQSDGVLVGDSAAAVGLRAAIGAAARSSRVWIRAPIGGGEEAVARLIHHQSLRSSAPFITVHGVELRRRPELWAERLRLARDATLFARHLSLVDADRLAEWLGALPDDVAVIGHGPDSRPAGFGDAASVVVPHLADRLVDLPAVAERILTRRGERLGRPGVHLTPDAAAHIQQYRWPGELTELMGVLDCALVAAEGDAVPIDDAWLGERRRVGEYELLAPIGRGGMGEVWVGRHRLLKRDAAVKLIRAEIGDRRRARERFDREARVIATLDSPHTVRLYDYGLGDDGTFYYVMELLRGMDLYRMIQAYGAMPAARALHLVDQAAGSLAEAHAAGLVHCDIKPENLFVCAAGAERDVLKVLDFGIVRGIGEDVPEVSGTPWYLSPEQALGDRVDGRADLYALGGVLYTLLTGQPVFPGTEEMAIVAHVTAPPPRVSDLVPGTPPALDQLVIDLLAKDPQDRPPDADALRQRIAALPIPSWTRADAVGWWSAHHDALVRAEGNPTEAGTEADVSRPSLSDRRRAARPTRSTPTGRSGSS